MVHMQPSQPPRLEKQPCAAKPSEKRPQPSAKRELGPSGTSAKRLAAASSHPSPLLTLEHTFHVQTALQPPSQRLPRTSRFALLPQHPAEQLSPRFVPFGRTFLQECLVTVGCAVRVSLERTSFPSTFSTARPVPSRVPVRTEEGRTPRCSLFRRSSDPRTSFGDATVPSAAAQGAAVRGVVAGDAEELLWPSG